MKVGKAITGVLFSALLALSLVGSAGEALAATSNGGSTANNGVTWDCNTFRGARCPLGSEDGNGANRGN